ncbi:MAG: hypothetical protein OQJ81_00985 [Melioribacteraceae bacterium]|nr:hypothetical protein [Melioribacteraceae bacterium]
MFKKEINFISDLNLNKLQVLGDRFTIEDLKSSRIHPAILHYINSSIDKEIFSDRKKIEDNSIFDYKTDRINNYFILISEEIKRTQHFELKYLKPLVQEAIIFNINFLTNPNKTLVKSIFADFNVKPIEEIVLGISQAYYYRYLQKILLTYLEKKKVLSLSKNEFIQLLERVDTISRETHLEDTLITAVNSITNFFDQNSKTPENLPLKAIELYLEEKKLDEFSIKLESKFIADSSTLFLGNDIINVLRSVTPESEIILEELKNSEDDLIVDNTTNEKISEIQNNEIGDEVSSAKDNDIFEVSDEEIDIPNNEILSNDEMIAEIETLKEDQEHETIIEEDFEELEEDSHDLENEPIDESNNSDFEEPTDEIGQKKKPNGIELLNKLIDVNPLFESLISSIKPFENYEDKLNLIESIKTKSEDLNYQLDISTLSEKMDVSSFEKHKINDSDNSEKMENPFENEDSIETPAESNVLEKDNFDIEESIADTVNDVNNEQEFLTAKEKLEELENDEAPEDSFIFMDEEHDEITEVFKDLTFLDSEENDDISIKNEIINTDVGNENETLLDQNAENNFTEPQDLNTDFYSSLLTQDMSKIIESVFDYDMEEYYSIINEVSQTSNEEDANKIFYEYCNNNHIDFDSKQISVFCEHPGVPEDESNLVIKAVRLFFQTLENRGRKLDSGLSIQIDKKIVNQSFLATV